MSALASLWLRKYPNFDTLHEKVVMLSIAGTSYGDGTLAEIDFDSLEDEAMIQEAQLRETLNLLSSKGLILDIEPSQEKKDRRYFCKIGTPEGVDPYI